MAIAGTSVTIAATEQKAPNDSRTAHVCVVVFLFSCFLVLWFSCSVVLSFCCSVGLLVRWSVGLLVGLFSSSRQALLPNQRTPVPTTIHGSTRTIPNSSPPSVTRPATPPRRCRRQVGTLFANLEAQYFKGRTPRARTEFGRYLKRIKSSLKKATEEVSLGPEVSPCPHFSQPICHNQQ